MAYLLTDEQIQNLTLMDDLLFRTVANDKEFCQEIIRVFLQDKELELVEAKTQYNISNLKGRGITIDTFCRTNDGKLINVEVQKRNLKKGSCDNDEGIENKVTHQKRVRYHAALMTANNTPKGENFDAIPDVCVIYLTANDIFNGGKTVYHVERTLKETGTIEDNGFTEVYVNGKVKDESEISSLMTVFTDKDTYDERFPIVSGSKKRYKEKEGAKKLMKTWQDVLDEAVEEAAAEARIKATAEGMAQGMAQGMEQGMVRGERIGVFRMYLQGDIPEKIAIKGTGLSEEEFRVEYGKWVESMEK